MAAKPDTKPHVKAVCVDDEGELMLFWLPIGERNPPLSSPRMELYRLVDRMLACVTNRKFSFLSELNDLQSNDDGETVFENKSDIPLRIVNLVLAPAGEVEDPAGRGVPRTHAEGEAARAAAFTH